jgi:PAS domain-containing protein
MPARSRAGEGHAGELAAEVDLPGEPFLLYFVIVLVSAGVFGRTPGFVAVAETTITSVLYFDPTYSLRLTHGGKDGAIVWCRKTVGPIRKGDGSVDYFVTVIEDISARKQAEMELREDEERFRSSLLQSPLPVSLFDD